MTATNPNVGPASVQHSAVESERFGRPIARLSLDDEEAAADASVITRAFLDADVDVLVLRYPARHVSMFAELRRTGAFDLLYADTLQYWEWRSDRPLPAAAAMLHPGDLERLPDLVRAVFAEYPNHYAANPLLDADAALEGYVEWVVNAVAKGASRFLALDDGAGGSSAFAVIDEAEGRSNVSLAGVHPLHRRRGCYRELITGVMRHARSAGLAGLSISTQAHNATVMSTWSSLGWRPVRTFTTVHLVRSGLLDSASTRV